MSRHEYDGRKDAFKLSKDPVKFINVGFVVTKHCNLKCVHCCESSSIQSVESLQTERQVIKTLANGGTRRLCVTGGEPLMRKDISDVLQFIHAQGIKITLATNGSLLTETKMKDIGPHIDNIRFSLYGGKSMHDRITGQEGSYETVMKGIAYAKEFNLPVGIVSTVMVQNYPEMTNIARLCAEKGVDILHFFSLMSKGKGAQIYPQEHKSSIEINQVVKDISKISRQESWNLRIDNVDWDKEGQCVLAYPNGDLLGSPSLSDEDTGHEKVIGNLLKQTPDELWESYPFKKNYVNHCREK